MVPLAAACHLDEPDAPSVRRWRKHYRRRLPACSTSTVVWKLAWVITKSPSCPGSRVWYLRLRAQHCLHHFRGKRDGHSGAGACADDPRHSAGSGRLHSHLPAEPRGSPATLRRPAFMQFFRVRETSMKMARSLPARKTYGLNLIGGIRRDLLKRTQSRPASTGAADAS